MIVAQVKDVKLQLAYVLFVIPQAAHVTNPVVVMGALIHALIAVETAVKIVLSAVILSNAVLIVYVIVVQ